MASPAGFEPAAFGFPGQRPQARPSAGDEDSQADVRPVDGAPVQHLGLTGVIFFDELQGQIGVAPNGVDLHAVLKVEAIR